jgi:uncharacterized coiled-coil protein SlyX
MVPGVFHESHDGFMTTLASFIGLVCCLPGALFACWAAVSAHIAHRIRRSLRAADADGDDARIYIPPVALLINGTRFARRWPYYEPATVAALAAVEDLRELGERIRELEVRLCAQEDALDALVAREDLRELGVRIRELEVRLQAQEQNTAPLAGLEGSV